MTDYLTNDWWNWVFSTYTFTISFAVSFVGMILKCLAIRHPGATSNTISEWWSEVTKTKWDGKDRRK